MICRSVYYFGETATNFLIERLFYAVSVHASSCTSASNWFFSKFHSLGVGLRITDSSIGLNNMQTEQAFILSATQLGVQLGSIAER